VTEHSSRTLTKNPYKALLSKIIPARKEKKHYVYDDLASSALSETTLYDAHNINSLDWPDTSDGIAAKDYYTHLIQDGVSHYIANISAQFCLIKNGNATLPILIATGNYDDSYVCSEYGHYVLLGLESLHVIQNPLTRKFAAGFLKSIGKIIKKGHINNVIYVNHSLFATDLQNNLLTTAQVDAITKYLQTKYPQHAIIFRGINSLCCPQLKDTLAKCNYTFIAGRQVQITDPTNPLLYETRIIKSDMRLWRDNPYTVAEQDKLSGDDDASILELYNKLAIENHSKLNPGIKLRYIKLLKNNPHFKIKTLKRDGKVEGAVGFATSRNAFTCLLFGYDKKQPDAPHLYRIMSTLLLLEAKKKGTIFHQSSGATFYKKIRRAKSITEYQAVYTKHLPAPQRAAWALLRTIMNTIAIPLMKKY